MEKGKSRKRDGKVNILEKEIERKERKGKKEIGKGVHQEGKLKGKERKMIHHRGKHSCKERNLERKL